MMKSKHLSWVAHMSKKKHITFLRIAVTCCNHHLDK